MSSIKLKNRITQNIQDELDDDNFIEFASGTIIPIFSISRIEPNDSEEWPYRYYLNDGSKATINQHGYDAIISKLRKYNKK